MEVVKISLLKMHRKLGTVDSAVAQQQRCALAVQQL